MHHVNSNKTFPVGQHFPSFHFFAVHLVTFIFLLM